MSEQPDERPSGSAAPDAESSVGEPSVVRETSHASATDPMKSFRRIVAATLVLETIVVGLALLVVAKIGGGIGSSQGFFVLALIVALLGTCALPRYRWSVLVIAGIHMVMLLSAFFFAALAAVGAVFTLAWVCLFLLRRDVAKKMAAGQLPSQQP